MAGRICPACKTEQTKKFSSSCEFCGNSFMDKSAVKVSSSPLPQPHAPSPRPTPKPMATETPQPKPQQAPPPQPASPPPQQSFSVANLSDEQRQQAVIGYFNPPEFGGFGCLSVLVGIFFFIVYNKAPEGNGGASFVIAMVCFAIAGHLLSKLKGGIPAHLIDQIIAFYMAHVKGMSLKKASIDESELVGESVTVTGPRFWNTGGAASLFRKGEDNILRFTPINVTILHLTQNQLIAYQCCLDLVNGTVLNQSTEEFFYKDVVSVATKTDSQTYDTEKFGRIQLNDAETFMLTTSGGTSIKTTLRDPRLIQLMGGGEIPTTETEKAIQVIRKMLREKKQN